MPFQGCYQLTFFNQYQLEASAILEIFNKFGPTQLGSKVFSCVKRRCYIHYKTEEEALSALEGLKDNNTIYNLEIAQDCLRRNKSPTGPVASKGPPEIYPNMGTYDLTFTTSRRIDVSSLRAEFGEYGTVDSVHSNFLPVEGVKGRSRVFVKFKQETGALAALLALKSNFKDLSVAKVCTGNTAQNKAATEPDTDGFYCVRFRNLDETGCEILERADIIELFNEFGAVQSVYKDKVKWCYVRYKTSGEAELAVSELQAAGQLPCIDHARRQDQQSVQLLKKRIKSPPPEESNLELLISNYPRATPARKLRKFFTLLHPFNIREMIVEGQKAYAFAQVSSYDDLKRGVQLYNNKDLNGRGVKVMAKLPHIQAKIMQELDREQSCSLHISSQAEHNQSPTADTVRVVRTVYDASDDNENEDSGFSIDIDRNARQNQVEVEMCDARSDDYSDSPKASNELVIANFSPHCSESDIRALLSEYRVESITVPVNKVTDTEPFTYAIVVFASSEEALDAVLQFDGSSNLDSDRLVLEFQV